MLSDEQVQELQQIAEDNNGHCDRCHRVIKIYRYRANKQMAIVLRKMRAEIDASGLNEVNFDNLNLPYRLGSQRTKMRLHGLIAKSKYSSGEHIANTWLITKKGGEWLRGEKIREFVVVFDNQVLGHEGRMVTINRAMGEAEFEAQPIAPAEAETYSDVRTPSKGLRVKALFVGHNYGGGKPYGKTGIPLDLLIDRLQFSSPVKILEPEPYEYPDIAAFQRDWKIIKNEGSQNA